MGDKLKIYFREIEINGEIVSRNIFVDDFNICMTDLTFNENSFIATKNLIEEIMTNIKVGNEIFYEYKKIKGENDGK